MTMICAGAAAHTGATAKLLGGIWLLGQATNLPSSGNADVPAPTPVAIRAATLRASALAGQEQSGAYQSPAALH